MAILGYKKQIGDEPAFWYGEIFGAERQFIRVVAGVSMPILDRVSAAVVVVGEILGQAGPQDLWVIDASVGLWPVVENSIIQFRRDLKFGYIICDVDQAYDVLRRRRDLYFGISDIPWIPYTAPPYALTEVGRSKTAQLRLEGRLHMDEMEETLDWDPEPSRLAMCSAVCWMLDHEAFYPTKQRLPSVKNILGIRGL